MTDTVLFILEIVGTAVFAASGALAGLQRQLDAFGVVILGVCTACGGGVIRDLTLGITPPVMFCQPVYALVAMGRNLNRRPNPDENFTEIFKLFIYFSAAVLQ